MSRYNTYGRNLDKIARENFATFQELEAAFREAKEQRDRTPIRPGQDSREAVAAHRAEIRYTEAKEKFEAAKRELPEATSQAVGELRRELVTEVEKYNAARPEDVDPATMALLQAGILSARETANLLENATPTMRRIIAKHAERAAVEAEKKGGANDPEAQLYRQIVYANGDTNQVFDRFDELAQLIDRTWNNTEMINYWPELTEGAIQNF